MTYNVDGLEHYGSSVMRVSYSRLAGTIGSNLACTLPPASFRGEAVAVDLGKYGLIFTTLKQDQARPTGPFEMAAAPIVYLPMYFHDQGIPRDTRGVDLIRAIIHDKPKATIPFDRLPLTVRFGSLAIPGSVERVDPLNLGAVYGTHVTLSSATIEICDDNPTDTVRTYLPWLSDIPERLFKTTNAFDRSLYQLMTHGDLRINQK